MINLFISNMVKNIEDMTHINKSFEVLDTFKSIGTSLVVQ